MSDHFISSQSKSRLVFTFLGEANVTVAQHTQDRRVDNYKICFEYWSFLCIQKTRQSLAIAPGLFIIFKGLYKIYSKTRLCLKGLLHMPIITRILPFLNCSLRSLSNSANDFKLTADLFNQFEFDIFPSGGPSIEHRRVKEDFGQQCFIHLARFVWRRLWGGLDRICGQVSLKDFL